MSQRILLWHILVVHSFIPQAKPFMTHDWKNGDWAMEHLYATNEPIDNPTDWANYLNTLGGEYDEYAELKTTTEVIAPPDGLDSRDWYPLNPGEDPYLAVIYRKDQGASRQYNQLFPGEPNPGSSHISPGTACGGALLTPKHVLTSCGCLLTLATRVHGINSPFSPGASTYDIFDEDKGILPTIYVSHVVSEFIPDFKHAIEENSRNWTIYSSLNCRGILERLEQFYMDWDERRKEAAINSEPIVVPFSPDIRPNFIKFFPQWPPIEINTHKDPYFKQRVALISIGMKLSKPAKKEFFSSITPSVTVLQHCKTNSFVCNTSREAINVLRVCFCPQTRGAQQLSGGVIGWPIVQKGKLAGIAASERLITDGSILGIVMYNSFVTRIEEYITRKVLLKQNEPPKQYRATYLKNKFLVYDYDSSRIPPRRGQSIAANVSPHTLAFFTPFIIHRIFYRREVSSRIY